MQAALGCDEGAELLAPLGRERGPERGERGAQVAAELGAARGRLGDRWLVQDVARARLARHARPRDVLGPEERQLSREHLPYPIIRSTNSPIIEPTF